MDFYKAGKWDIFLTQGGMLGSESLDLLSNKLGIKVPEIVYENSSVKLVNEEFGVVYEINTVKALELIGFNKRNELLYTDGPLKEFHISLLPKDLKVAMATHWEGRTVPKTGNFSDSNTEQVLAQVCDFGSDWTFSTPYKGNVEGRNSINVEVSDENIPVERLGLNNPIL